MTEKLPEDASCVNAFGWPLYSVAAVLRCPTLRGLVAAAARKSLGELGVPRVARSFFVSRMLGMGTRERDEDIEKRLKAALGGAITSRRVTEALQRRARRIGREVRPWVSGSSVLDIGCGDGLVGALVQRHVPTVVLLDVHRYVNRRVSLPFLHQREGAKLAVQRQFDTTLLLTVLHHSRDPVFLLREARRITRRRCIIIESVFGVQNAHGKAELQLANRVIHEQVMYATFVDWLYNRVIQTDVAVPYNFTTPRHWLTLLHECGFEVEGEVDLGIDQPLVPEHHFMWVVR